MPGSDCQSAVFWLLPSDCRLARRNHRPPERAEVSTGPDWIEVCTSGCGSVPGLMTPSPVCYPRTTLWERRLHLQYPWVWTVQPLAWVRLSPCCVADLPQL